MKTMTSQQYRAKEFAARAGVTVRTLHLYDQMELLPPAERTESGYRLYGERELERLEQIVALRFVGFSLQEIKELLTAETLPLIVALRMQREIIRQRRTQLDRALDAIERAESAIGIDREATRWEALRTIIEVMKLENNDWSWTKNYYSAEAQEKIDVRAAAISKEDLEAGQRAWTQLIAEVEAAAKHENPSSDRAQELAKRWKALVHEFTGGDPAIHSGLNKLWSDRTHWPKDFKRPWSDDADRFIKAAMNCRASE
jgi:DNA-binding transcriptional MerR regulator